MMEEDDQEIIDIGELDDSKQEQKPLIETTLIESNTNEPKNVSQNSDMDEESRQLIEQMLAEEEYFYGRDTISTLNKHKKTEQKRKKAVKVDQDYDIDFEDISAATVSSKKPKTEGSLSSVSLPSHKTRWNKEEDARLIEAVNKFGYGNWKLISDYVESRNPLQCKNHARHLKTYDKIPSPTTESPPSQTSSELPIINNNPQVLDNEENISEEDYLSIDGGVDGESDQNSIESVTDLHVEMQKNIPDPNGPADTRLVMPNELPAINTTSSNRRSSDSSSSSSSIDSSNSSIISTTVTSPPTISAPTVATMTDKSNTQSEKNPPSDIPSFNTSTITEDEQIHNSEWFQHKHSKTPDRYLKIRNHMIACWNQCKPKYLTKTSARKGLKDCGDVNAIGRVHSYLEAVRAINLNCTTTAPRPPKRMAREQIYQDDDEAMFDASDLVVGYDGPRKRKVRNERGEWVDPRELEGRVIEHGQVIVRLDTKPKRTVVKRLNNQYYGGDEFGRGYDPFRLVPTDHYNDLVSPPFEVEIVSDALLIMDFHAHLAHTEIIGLLGGNFLKRGDAKILQVLSVFPCKSTSTGIQCEMDPVSEMQAREVFAQKGFNVVGWYHSHPTFEPHPSIRDIENQTSYQTLFKDESSGDEPFIGVIVTPYDPEIMSEHSQIQYLHISKEWDELHSFRMPFACRRTVIQSEQLSPEIFAQLQELIEEYKDYEHKVNMLLLFGEQSRLEKLLDSLKAHIFVQHDVEDEFIKQVKDLVLTKFTEVDQDSNSNHGDTSINNTSSFTANNSEENSVHVTSIAAATIRE